MIDQIFPPYRRDVQHRSVIEPIGPAYGLKAPRAPARSPLTRPAGCPEPRLANGWAGYAPSSSCRTESVLYVPPAPAATIAIRRTTPTHAVPPGRPPPRAQ